MKKREKIFQYRYDFFLECTFYLVILLFPNVVFLEQ